MYSWSKMSSFFSGKSSDVEAVGGGNITINGVDYGNAKSVKISKGRVYVDGKLQESKAPLNGPVELVITGRLSELHVDGNATVLGDVMGPVLAGGDVTVGGTANTVQAGGNVRTGCVIGSIQAGGDVHGNYQA